MDARGQLLLVGAVTLAIVIVGLAVVTNTVLFTENVGPGEARSESAAVEEFDYEVEKTARSLFLRVNHGERERDWDGPDGLEPTLVENIDRFSDQLSRSYAAAGTVFVDVRYRDTVYNGTRIVQGVDRNFTYNASHDGSVGSNVEDWSVLPADDRADVGWFVLNVNLLNTSGDQTEIEVENTVGERLTYRLNRSGDGEGRNLSLAVVDETGAELDDAACRATGGRVLLDIFEGEAFGGDCSFPSMQRLEPPYSVVVRDGGNLNGRFAVVANITWYDDESRTLDADDGAGSLAYPHCSAAGQQPPCLSPVVWRSTVELVYQSTAIDYDTSRNVTVYDTAKPDSDFPDGTVFTGDPAGIKRIAGQNGAVTTISTPSTPEALGPPTRDITGDGQRDLVYVDTTGTVRAIESDGDVAVVASDTDMPGGATIATTETRLVTGTWDGAPSSVFFANAAHDALYRATPSGGVTEVAAPGDGVQAVVGVGDVDGDDDDELVFVDASQTLQYLESGGGPAVEVPNGGVGANTGIGAGSIADFNGDGTADVVTADSGNDIKLVNATGSRTLSDLDGSGNPDVAKASVSAVDVDGDGDPEIVYVDLASGDLRYVDTVAGTPTVEVLTDDTGSAIGGSDETGAV